MKIQKLMLSLSCAAAAAVAMTVSCSEIDMYSVDAPEDLQERIDEIAEQNKPTDDGSGIVPVVLQATNVGANDGTSAWWTEFSDYFTIPTGKLLHLEFVNNGTGVNNWNNWNLAVTNPYERPKENEASSYAEYFVLRSDSYGWGNADYQGALIANDYPDLDEDGDIWNDFRAIMQGAYVTMTVDHSTEGYVFVTAVAEGTDGTVITETYNQPVSSTEDIWAFIICDGSWFEMKKAWLAPSEAKPVEDVQPASITASGYPTTIEIGSEDFWGEAVATVTYEDGVSEQVSSDDLTFTVPDLTTVGTKTILYSYSKTKMGNYGKAVAGYYTIEVVNPVVAISAEAVIGTIGAAKYVTLSEGAVKVTAILADESRMVLPNGQCKITLNTDNPVYSGAEATYEKVATVVYTTSSGTELTAEADLVVRPSSLPAQTEPVGLEDCTTAFWSMFTQDWKVSPNESVSVSMSVKSNNAANWNSPTIVLRNSIPQGQDGYTEYVVARMDNWNWMGASTQIGVLTSNWDWDTFQNNVNGSIVSITVTNRGDNYANIRYFVISADFSEHFQYHDIIAVNSAVLTFAVFGEGCYLVFD